MTTPKRKPPRRSLLQSAIDTIGTASPADNGESDDHVDEAPSPTPDRSDGTTFLKRRGAAMDELSRKVKKLTIRVKPSECSIWPGNARDYNQLTADRCRTLIDSILSEGGNREPVVIRRTPDAELPYELIVGTRRHFSVSWLNAHDHPELFLIASVETLDDEAAFRLADLENREREDVTDLERAINYKHAIATYYAGSPLRMAERLAISRQKLHNILQLAELPNAVVSAFGNAGNLAIRHGMKLSPLIKDESKLEAIELEADKIALEQKELVDNNSPLIDGAQVCSRLVAAAQTAPKPRKVRSPKAMVRTSSGREVGQILADTVAKGITINLKPEVETSIEEILEALRPLLEQAKCVSRKKP